MKIADVVFQDRDVAQFMLGCTEDPAGLQVEFRARARVPVLGVLTLPAASGKVPRSALGSTFKAVLGKLPPGLPEEIPALVTLVLGRLTASASGLVVLTLGDRTKDDKMDVTVDASGQTSGGTAFAVGPLTFQPPVVELLDVVGTAVQAIPVPGVQTVAFLALAFAKAALRALHFA